MKIWSLTFERAEELRRQKEEEVKKLEATSSEQIWSADLDAIEEAMAERDVLIAADLKDKIAAQSKNKARVSKKKATKKPAAKKAAKKKKGDVSEIRTNASL